MVWSVDLVDSRETREDTHRPAVVDVLVGAERLDDVAADDGGGDADDPSCDSEKSHSHRPTVRGS